MTSAVSLQDLSVRFGGVCAVNGVDLEVEPRRIVGFLGPNGAGKTTILDAISGLVASTGRVWIGEREVTHRSPAQRARAGLARSFQDGRLFPGLTVRETIAVGYTRQTEALGFFPTALGLA